MESNSQSSFHFLFWPTFGSLSQTVSQGQPFSQSLQKAWQDSRLLGYLGRPLICISSKTDSVEKYLQTILYSRPECIEGDAGLLEKEINPKERLYDPLLQRIPEESDNQIDLRGEIVFLDRTDLWQGRLGVIHSQYEVGGGFQIAYWKQETGAVPDIVTLYSPWEALRHLMVGSIQAAAIPVGVLETFLKIHHREDLLDRVLRIRMPVNTNLPMIYLRHDLYVDPLMRTLIAETWLRDRFPDLFVSAPFKAAY